MDIFNLWWWIEPLFITGFVFLVIAWIFVQIVKNSDIDAEIVGKVILILLIPFIVSCVSAILCVFINLLKAIWTPYL